MQLDSYDSLESRSTKEREETDLLSLIQQVKSAKGSSEYWSEILSDIDEQSLTSFEQLASWPMLAKSELIDMQGAAKPYGRLINPEKQAIRRVFYSPGPIVEPQAMGEKDSWQMARALFSAGFREGDVVANCFSYHLTPAGFMFDEAAAEIGCTVFPAGVGNVETLVQAFNYLKIGCYVGTPDFLKVIIEKSEAMGELITSVKKACVSGGPLFPDLRQWYLDRGIAIYQCYGTAELGLIAYETNDGAPGMVLNENCYVEIVATGTSTPVCEGEVGEVVVTTFNRKYPLIRFATGDLSAFIKNKPDAKFSNKRLQGWLGRADQTAKVRGMFVHPKQVIRVADKFPSIKKVRVEISEKGGRDDMVFLCESSEQSQNLEHKLKDAIRSECRLRGEVVFVDFNSLPNDGKVIDDKRRIIG